MSFGIREKKNNNSNSNTDFYNKDRFYAFMNSLRGDIISQRFSFNLETNVYVNEQETI